MSEMAIVTSRKSRLKQEVVLGNKRAKEALKITESPNNFLSTIQVGITLIAILSGAFAGEAITRPLSNTLSDAGILDKYSEIIALGIVVTLITFFSLIFGELVPKRIALKHPETIAMFAAFPMKILSLLTIPVVYFLTLSTDIVLRILKQDPKSSKNSISREEVNLLLSEGIDEGTFEKEDVDMINSVFKLSDITVKKIMIPRSKVIAFDLNDSMTEVMKVTRNYHHSRYPVYDKTKDNIIGFVHVKDIYLKMIAIDKKHLFIDILKVIKISKNEQRLKDLKIIRAISAVDSKMKIDDAMFVLKKMGSHIAVVTEGKDKKIGVIAFEDILEKVFGEIKDEFDVLPVTKRK